jgi:2-polyprenyl-6-methoxyphenol hydroxylase-like FAD-dependent oxidoreductase/ubiquinone/menaquinone biosynthesis C-methylase UbiE
MSAASLNVVVVGGGIAGLCLAQGLRQAGVEVAVYERDRSPSSRLEGYRIHVDPEGAKALHACLPEPIWQRFVASAVHLGAFRFVSEQLEELAVLEREPEGASDPLERAHAIDRVTLRELLLAGLDGVVRFDKRFERYEQTQHGRVVVHFTDGSRALGDVLVGADGVGSRVRQQYLPQAQIVDTDAFGVGLKLPLTTAVRAWLAPPLSAGRSMVMAPAPYFLSVSVFDRASSREEGYVGSAFVGRRDIFPPSAPDFDGAALRELILRTIAGWHPQLRRLVAESDPKSALLVPYRTSLEPPPWQPTNVTLMGDAIHAMSPVGGLGGNAALRDAALLCERLVAVRDGADRLAAIGEYEAGMREQGFAAVRKAQYYQQQGLRTEQLGMKEMMASPRPAIRATRDVSAREGYDIWAEVYDESPNPVVAMDERHTLGMLACRPGERILDAGCGTGRHLGRMLAAGSQPTGLDFSSGMLAVARRRHPGVPLLQGDLEAAYPFADGAFDAALCALVAEHLEQPELAFREMARVLGAAGRLVFSVFHPRMAAAGMQAQFIKGDVGYRLGAQRHTVDDYVRWMAAAGFEIERKHELVGDEALIATMPFMRALVGFPVLLVLEARKSARAGARP